VPEALPSSATEVAHIVQLALAPVFLLAGIGAFLNACTTRLARIVDRGRVLEPLILKSAGREHDRYLAEIRVIDRRMGLVSWAIFLSVFSAMLICTVVILQFSAALIHLGFGTPIALLFIASMLCIALGFHIFLIETRMAARNVRIRSELLEHQAE
jgi:hypothetical protein